MLFYLLRCKNLLFFYFNFKLINNTNVTVNSYRHSYESKNSITKILILKRFI